VITQAMLGPSGKYGMVATIGSDGEPAYVYDTSPAAEVMYEGNFYFNPNHAVTASPVNIFLGLDQNQQFVFGVQYKYLDANSFTLRAWAKLDDMTRYTSWEVFAVDPGEDASMVLIHKIDVCWVSGMSGGLTLYFDGQRYQSLIGDTSASQLEEVLLGPSLGLTAYASGSMYFDEFTSSRVLALSYLALLPSVSRGSAR
jgi:hypothetical protein